MIAEPTAKAKFDYVFNKANSLLILLSIRELSGELLNLVPPPRLPGPLSRILSAPVVEPLVNRVRSVLDRFKGRINDWVKVVDNSLCEVIVVQCVTALEVYLEEVYHRRTSNQWEGRKLENVRTLQDWRSNTNINPFQTVATSDLDKVFQMRHVIVHQGGLIDQTFITTGLASQEQLGHPINEILDMKSTRNALNTIKAVVSSIESQLV